MLKLPGGAPMGPLALDIVAELVRQGEITEDYLYTTADADEWRPIRELPGLPEPAFRAPQANKLKAGKADFGQLLTSSLAAAATYTQKESVAKRALDSSFLKFSSRRNLSSSPCFIKARPLPTRL